MRILYIHQYFGTPAGSSGTRSYEMARKLIQAGHEVTMICGSSDRSQTGLTGNFDYGRRTGTVEGINIVEFNLTYQNSDNLPVRALKFAQFALRSIGFALSRRFDVTIATTTPLTVVIPAIAARLFKGVPFVFECRDLWPEIPKAMGVKSPLALLPMHLMEWLGCKFSLSQIALAPGIAKGMEKAGSDPDSITLIPNGCDHELFDSVEAIRPAQYFPDKLGSEDFVAVFAGAHGRANGLDAVLDAAAVLRDRHITTIKILLIGDGSEKARLMKRADKEQLDSVIFESPIPKTTLAGILKGADCGLQSLANLEAFYNGTSPNKFFDYLAASLPVVINYPGWLGEMVEIHECGIAVPPDEPTALAEALSTLARNPSLRQEMAAKSYALGQQEFGRESAGARFVTVIENTAKAQKR